MQVHAQGINALLAKSREAGVPACVIPALS